MFELSSYFDRLFELLQHDEIKKALFAVLPISAAIGFAFGQYFPKHPQSLVRGPIPTPNPDPKVTELEALIKDLEKQLAVGPEAVVRARSAVAASGPGLWLAIPPMFPEGYSKIERSIPILTVANLKGGVGKTTIASGLAAYFANPLNNPNRRRKRVLLIDLDFQGSLSSMALNSKDRRPQTGGMSKAARLISGACSGLDLLDIHHRVKELEKLPGGGDVELYAVPAYYDLAQTENRLMVEWLLSDGTQDIRYNLAKTLLSKEVQSSYDQIIIDAPPRLSTAHVQALAASTHVLIPTVLDQLSGEAVGGFVEQALIHADLWPNLKIIGVVGSMTQWDQDKALQDYESEGVVGIREALLQLKDTHQLSSLPAHILPRSAFVPDLKELGRSAGRRIGYLTLGKDVNSRTAIDKVRRVFDQLGSEIDDVVPKLKPIKELRME